MAKSNRADVALPRGGTRTDQATLIAGEEVLVPLIVELAKKYGPAIGHSIYKAFKSDNPLFVQIEASWKEKESEYYYISLRVRNLTEHGVYLENLCVKTPKDTPLCVLKSDNNAFSFGDEKLVWGDSSDILPRLLEPGANATFQMILRLKDFKSERSEALVLAGRETVELAYKLSRLDKEKPEERELSIQLRKSGPSFRNYA